jgi:AraC-like DNA-binding protein
MILFFIAGGGFLVGLFAAALLWNSTRGNRRANRVLALLMVASSLNIVHPLVTLLAPQAAVLRGSLLTEPLQFLMAPLIAAYIHQLMLPDLRFRPGSLLHFVPFAAVVALSISPLPGILNRAAGFPAAAVVFWTLLLAQVSVYVIPSFGHLHGYRAALRDQVSNTTGIDLKWLRWFMHVMVALYLSYAVILAFVIHGVPSPHVRAFLSLALAGYVCALAYRGIAQKETPRLEALAEAPPTNGGGKYLRGAMAPDEAVELQRKLERAMETEKLYLDPDLDLSSLAGRVGAARNQLSYVINQNLGRNFYDYVNDYRVREVLRLMEDDSRANDKMITLAFDAGFNSKPTFNAVFKRITGRTPSDYRQKSKNRV